MKDIGEANVVFSIKMIRYGSRIKLSQFPYFEKVLKRFSMLNKTPISTPMELGMKLCKHTNTPISQLEYPKVVGSLMYAIMCTRPDMAFVVAKLSWFTSNLGPHD